jgi:tetrahydromethanopterin S-methyltransferase subunit G
VQTTHRSNREAFTIETTMPEDNDPNKRDRDEEKNANQPPSESNQSPNQPKDPISESEAEELADQIARLLGNVFGLTLTVLTYILYGAVLKIYWDWFVASSWLLAPALPIPNAIATVAIALTLLSWQTQPEAEVEAKVERIGKRLGRAIGKSLFLLLFGWILHWFVGG